MLRDKFCRHRRGFYYAILVLEHKTSLKVNTKTLKNARIDRPHILASHRCETFQKLLDIDIAQVRRTFSGILLSKNER